MIGLALACLAGAGVPTPIEPVELARVLAAAHVAVFHAPPSPARLRVAVAHTLLEGARVTRCRNLGMVTARRGLPFWRPRGSGLRMRSYPTWGASAGGYWRALRPAVLCAFDAGDGYQAGRQLARSGYYTAPAESYSRALAAVLRGL